MSEIEKARETMVESTAKLIRTLDAEPNSDDDMRQFRDALAANLDAYSHADGWRERYGVPLRRDEPKALVIRHGDLELVVGRNERAADALVINSRTRTPAPNNEPTLDHAPGSERGLPTKERS